MAHTVKRTSCYQCTTDCGFDAEVDERGRVVKLTGPDCDRGAAQLDVQYHRERLLYPLRRSGDGFARATWDEALDEIAARLQEVRRRHGPESVAFVVGYTKEARPYLQRLAHGFGSPNYMTESSCCFSATSVAAEVTYGRDFGYFLASSRYDSAGTRCLLVWSTNPFESSIPYERHFAMQDRAQRARIVVDPRRTPLAERADVHLQIRPGTDGALALGLHHLLFENGWVDAAFLRKWATGVEEFRRYAAGFPPERVSEICRVPEEQIREAARLYGTLRPAQIVISPNSTVHHTNGFQNHRAILLLPAATGNLDVEGGNRRFVKKISPEPIDLFEERIGNLPPRIGQERFPVWCAHYAEAQAMGLADAILEDRPYPVRAVFGLGMNLMMWPDSRRLAGALGKLDFFSIIDFFHTPTTRLAHVVLPAATSLEREALITWGKGRVVYRQAAVAPEGEARSDAQIVLDVGCRLGMPELFWNGDFRESVRERLRGIPEVSLEQVLAQPFGISVREGEALPERAYETLGFGTPSGKVEFDSAELRRHGIDGLPTYREPAESPVSTPELARDYPLVLTSGGRSRNFTHSQHRQIARLREREPNPRVQIHPKDAADRGIADGDRVVVSSPRGSVRFVAWVTDQVAPGVAHVFHGWAEANVNELMSDRHLDPVSGFPAFKSSLCQVEPAVP
jgi:anaerobic selenocysteine-containing dehydrogenase